MTDFSWIEKLNDDFYDVSETSDDMYAVGDAAFEEFCTALTKFPNYNPFEYQLSLMNLILPAAIATYYFYIWNDYQNTILKRFGLLSIPSLMTSCASRQDGKSTTFQILTAALLLTVPRRTKSYRFGVGIVSNNFIGSKKMINDVYNLLNSVKDQYPNVKIQKNATDILVYHKDGMNQVRGFQTGEV